MVCCSGVITMDMEVFSLFKHFGLAILLGALMGLERERKETRLAGLRTFILVTLFGTLCGQIAAFPAGRWIVFAGMVAIIVQAAMVHVLRAREELKAGLTTSTALLVAYGIGVLVAEDQTLAAVSLSLATTVVLYFKPQLHEFSRNLSERDLFAIFQFGLIAFVILPILPDRGFGPYEALNPYNIWLMVVMISAINLVGYVILKIAGQHWGGPVIGILGGIVSSTATTLSFSRYTRDKPELSMIGAVVVSLASTTVLIRMAFLIGIIHAELLNVMMLPLLAMFFCGLLPVFFVWKKAAKHDAPPPETRNPAELKQALLFGLIYAIVILAVSAGKEYFGNKGVYIVSLVSGLTDVDAITLSNSRLAAQSALAHSQAAISILIAYVSNLVFKLVLVGMISTRQMFRWSLVCFVCLALPALLVLI
jgi:uncharacterized membrane protein (DUF4010 family)